MTQIASQYSGFAASSATMQSTTQVAQEYKTETKHVANTYGTQQAANTYGTQQWMPGAPLHHYTCTQILAAVVVIVVCSA
eukprot:6471324-Amphidinium_carterae.1